jgi:uncharacterized protein YndB with AHSA1/START domain
VIEPLRLDFTVACSPEHAFATWGERFAQWWPPDHTATGANDSKVVLEPRVGGRLYERTSGGQEVDWGEITVWEPPRRLAYLWHIRRDRADATDVEITFVDLGDGTTRVEIEQRGWERLGAAGEAWRDRNRNGWAVLIPHFKEAAER